LPWKKTDFHGKFENGCQEKSLLKMIMGGTNIETQSSNVIKAQATLTIAQLIRFNCTVRRRKDTLAMYHTKECEPPLPFFVGFYYLPKLERGAWLTRCVTLDYQYLTIEFYRSLQRWVMPNAADSMQRRLSAPKLRKGLFTTSAVDNIDHNP